MGIEPKDHIVSRRAALKLVAASAVTISGSTFADTKSTSSRPRTNMGLVIYDFNFRRKWMRKLNAAADLFEPLTFLKHCHSLGVGGMQANLGVMQPDDVSRLREFAERQSMFIDAIIRPPKDDGDLSRFEAEVRTARDVGVQAARTTIIPGRRYERFDSLNEFREYERRGREILERAANVVKKHRIPLAVENHKDQRIDERIALFEHLDSEFIGACVDTGNSFALLDGAYEPIEALAPYAFTVHLKDQALREYEKGFLLGDIPLGQGSFDLKRIVATIRKAKPDIRFALELITRDPLKVPCLTDHYFATMPTVPAADLARTMRFVREHSRGNLQQVSALALDDQVKLEYANVEASIRYAGTELSL